MLSAALRYSTAATHILEAKTGISVKLKHSETYHLLPESARTWVVSKPERKQGIVVTPS